MEIEQKQAPLIEQFVKQASTLNGPGPALVKLIVEATSHPSLFAFSEILSVPNLLQLQGTESSVYIDLLRLFAHGTWTDYKSNAAHLPQLVPDQAVKLKQLSVLTLAEMNKVLSYDQLLKELEVANVRELEDFLINECMYVVQFAAGRDLRHGQLENMMQSLTNWLDTSDNVLSVIQDKIKWAETMCEEDKKHKMEVKSHLQDVKKSVHSKSWRCVLSYDHDVM
ncbi:COP9 signalosome complex subunit 7 [Citrus sinensis]|uniref:COP9 signalosome complex subunit 7 n=1 Tax=Citrus sinensis TaxID=2711 RepID=A0ACB8LUL1_CITSI|nr:COP9 signalosome complex subunit 7 [Citrus sinensis]